MKLPSLLDFQPRFYRGGPIRHHLAPLYDLVATLRPRRLVVVGFGEGEAFFTLCQAVQENHIECECFALWRGTSLEADTSWQEGERYAAATYPGFAHLLKENSTTAVNRLAAEKIDLLLLDQSDRGREIAADLEAWSSTLAPAALVLLHGTQLQRDDAPKFVWQQWNRDRLVAELSAGIGLGLSWSPDHPAADRFPLQEFSQTAKAGSGLAQLYRVVAARIEAQAQLAEARRETAALFARQVWLDSILEDRWTAQSTMDEQAEQVIALRQDRAKAQLIMDAQAEQLRQLVKRGEILSAERKQLKATVAEQKRILNEAKKACRKKGRCFGLSEKKERRPIAQRVLRELRRMPANLSRLARRPEPAPSARLTTSVAKADRYAEWMAAHEPDAAGLEKQRAEAATLEAQPKISLLLPIFNTPVGFLEALLVSLAAQTYGNFEICAVDGGSSEARTIECLKNWTPREPRLRVEFLPQNLGVAENTNRALTMASGDFIACIDHDDLLPPCALFEMARAIARHPAADVFYSDEDRLSETGQRHSPFFKPDWNPDYLLSSMYLGHLTAYHRDLVRRTGPFRSEFELSQDYDFALRATEVAREIIHVPHVLYHWREHPASGSAGGKPDARKTNLAALAAAMERRGLRAEIMEYPAANRACLTISDWPRVSIIIPTDSAERGKFLVEELPKMTSYRDYEVVLVTNSALARLLENIAPKQPPFQFVRYDQPFNFSDKCNRGAQASTGQRLIFFNDDVESAQPDWIENLIEPLENPAIGAVAPKLLYETGKIQHAGLVTGVRGLVGTACHQWEADSTRYTNFAQSMRDVSALSGACLALRRSDFFAIGEWETENVPIAHSDLDLCFKLRARGLRCVYTPFVTMRHRGHASIGAQEQVAATTRRDKPSVFLLKRWPQYSCHDPYLPDNMRDWLYADSPTPIRMWARDVPATGPNQGDLLLISHDLSWSGAPLILLQLATWLKAKNYFVTVMSPVDGPVRAKFFEAGIPLIVDPLIVTGHESFAQFAREFDCVVASTIFGAPIVHAAKAAGIPHLWWVHEGRVAEDYLGHDEQMRAAFRLADLIVTPDTKSAQVYQPYSNRVIRVVNYGIVDPNDAVPAQEPRRDGKVKFLILGTIENRKGQQVLLHALALLPADVLERAEFQIVGRPHDLELTAKIEAAVREYPGLTYQGGISQEEAWGRIRQADVMISASRDETGPLILMEALALGTAIISTTVGCVSENLADTGAGIFFPPGNESALAAAITRLVREPQLLAQARAEARPAYEKYFTFDRFGQDFRRFLEETMGAPLASPAAP